MYISGVIRILGLLSNNATNILVRMFTQKIMAKTTLFLVSFQAIGRTKFLLKRVIF